MLIAEWLELQQQVLSYVFFKGKESALAKAAARLHRDCFSDKRRALWDILIHFQKVSSGVLDLDTLRKFLRSKNITEEVIFETEKEICHVEPLIQKMDDTGFAWHIGRLDEVYKQIKFDEFVDSSRATMVKGGFARGRDELLISLAKLDGTSADVAPDGLLQDTVDDFIVEVANARDNRAMLSLDFGWPSVDKEILGLRGGEVVLLVGWQGVGKTMAMVNIGVNNAFVQNKNVVFVTTETVWRQVRRRVISCLSKMVDGFDVPVSSQIFKSGKLNETERTSLLQIQSYIKAQGHGQFMICQAPANATLEWLRAKLLQYESQFKVDILLLDDIRNMTPTVRRRQDFEEVAQLLRDFKKIARTHANRGIPVVSPYHINRESYRQLTEKEGSQRCGITMSGLASSAEAERITDVALFLWARDDSPSTLEMTIVKNRDGAGGKTLTLNMEKDFQFITERQVEGVSLLDSVTDDDEAKH